MYYYYNYNVKRTASYIKIIAEKFLDFQHGDNEIITQGTPKWWDDYVISKINLCEFNIYFLCAYTAIHGQYNRVTDYKKVWGLQRTEKGFYDNYYDNANGRVYFGIQKGSEKQLLNNMDSSTILLLPKKFELDANKIFSVFREHKFNFIETEATEYQTLAEINMLYEGSIILKYNSTNEVSLLVFNDRLEDWFNDDVLALHNCASETVYRK